MKKRHDTNLSKNKEELEFEIFIDDVLIYDAIRRGSCS
jgi:hypothetical protein